MTEIYTPILEDALNKVESSLDNIIKENDLFTCQSTKNKIN